MELLHTLLTSPVFAYLLLGVLLLEATGLLVLWRLFDRGLPPSQTISFLGAGAAFATALLILASDGPPAMLALSLCVAFGFHLIDICLRWQN